MEVFSPVNPLVTRRSIDRVRLLLLDNRDSYTFFDQRAMAKFVIAGKANCPHFAKAELLGDYLQRNLPHFSIHKWPIANNVEKKH